MAEIERDVHVIKRENELLRNERVKIEQRLLKILQERDELEENLNRRKSESFACIQNFSEDSFHVQKRKREDKENVETFKEEVWKEQIRKQKSEFEVMESSLRREIDKRTAELANYSELLRHVEAQLEKSNQECSALKTQCKEVSDKLARKEEVLQDMRNEFNETIRSNNLEIQSLKNTIFNSSSGQSKTSSDQLKNELETLKPEYKKLEAENKSLADKVTNLQNSLKTGSSVVSELEITLNELRKAKEALDTELLDEKHKSNEFALQVQQLLASKETLQKERDDCIKSIENLNLTTINQSKKYNEQSLQLKSSREDLKKVNEELELLKEALEEAKAESSEKIQESDHHFRLVISDLEAQLAQYKETESSIKTAFDAKQKELSELKTTVENIFVANSDAIDDLMKQKIIAEHEDKMQEKMKEFAEIAKEPRDNIKNTLKEYEQLVLGLKKQLEDQKEEYLKFEASSQERIDSLTKVNENLSYEIARNKEGINHDVEDLLKSLNEQVSIQKKGNLELKQNLEQVNAELQMKKDELENLKKRQPVSSNGTEKLLLSNFKIDELSQSISALKIEKENLIKNLRTLEDKLGNTESMNFSLKLEKEQLLNMKTENSKLQKESQDLKVTLKKLQDERKSYTDKAAFVMKEKDALLKINDDLKKKVEEGKVAREATRSLYKNNTELTHQNEAMKKQIESFKADVKLFKIQKQNMEKLQQDFNTIKKENEEKSSTIEKLEKNLKKMELPLNERVQKRQNTPEAKTVIKSRRVVVEEDDDEVQVIECKIFEISDDDIITDVQQDKKVSQASKRLTTGNMNTKPKVADRSDTVPAIFNTTRKSLPKSKSDCNQQ